MPWKPAYGLKRLSKYAKDVIDEYGLVLVDANNLLFRSHLGYMKNLDIQKPGLFGFLLFLSDLLATFPKIGIVLCWDSGWDRERLKIYPEYKQNRLKKVPEIPKGEIRDECKEMENISKCLPVLTAVNHKLGTEGDDVIFSVLEDSREGDAECRHLLVTDDSDLLQLVSSDTDVYAPMKKAFFTKRTAPLSLGFPPERVVFYKALTGDVSDNISGVPGVGKKTASELVRRYANLDEVEARAKEFVSLPRIGKKVYEVLKHKDIVERNLKLVRLRRVSYELDEGVWDRDSLFKYLEEVGLLHLLSGFEIVIGGQSWG